MFHSITSHDRHWITARAQIQRSVRRIRTGPIIQPCRGHRHATIIPSSLSFPALRIRHSPCGSLCRFWTAKQDSDRQTDCLEILSHTHAPLLVLDGVHRNAVNLSKWLCAGCTSMLTDLKYTDGILPQWLLRASTHGARGERANRQFAWFTHSEKKTSLNGSLPNPLLSGPIPPHARYAFTRPAEVLNRSVFSFQLLTFLLPSFPHWLWTCCVKLDTHIFNTLEWAAKPTGQI